jgi:hypothetical protein
MLDAARAPPEGPRERNREDPGPAVVPYPLPRCPAARRGGEPLHEIPGVRRRAPTTHSIQHEPEEAPLAGGLHHAPRPGLRRVLRVLDVPLSALRGAFQARPRGPRSALRRPVRGAQGPPEHVLGVPAAGGHGRAEGQPGVRDLPRVTGLGGVQAGQRRRRGVEAAGPGRRWAPVRPRASVGLRWSRACARGDVRRRGLGQHRLGGLRSRLTGRAGSVCRCCDTRGSPGSRSRASR